jgi:hypothetical protein
MGGTIASEPRWYEIRPRIATFVNKLSLIAHRYRQTTSYLAIPKVLWLQHIAPVTLAKAIDT